MTTTLTNPMSLWQRVIDSHREYSQAFTEFTGSAEKIEILRRALRSRERNLALRAVPSLNLEERKSLFTEWIHLARCAHSPFQVAWNVLESLPRDWVLQNIEKEVDAILENDEETDYWMFLQLYARLDDALMKKLATRAANHADADIRELGQEYLVKPSPLT